MVSLCHGWGKIPFKLFSTSRYMAEEIYNMTNTRLSPFWLKVEEVYIPVEGTESLWLACQASSAYHNAIAYNAVDNTSFTSEMKEIEENVRVHMNETSSDTDENEKVYSDEDLVYDNFYYM